MSSNPYYHHSYDHFVLIDSIIIITLMMDCLTYWRITYILVFQFTFLIPSQQNYHLCFPYINYMRSNRKALDRQDLNFAQNIESYLQARAYNREITPEQANNTNFERTIQNIKNYKAISDLVDVEMLRSGGNVEMKRYKQSFFWGKIIDGRREGVGVMVYANGRVYQGEWSGNFRNGKGFEKFVNGSTYKGGYVNGKPEEYGRYQWENGQVYEGQWKNGLKHGSGIWRGSKGDSYIGQWQQGKAQGYGVHTWTNGDRYEGQFKNCLKHGEGVERFFNGDTYKGFYQNGKPSGYGEYYWSSGSFFKGNFKDGLRNGQGVWKKGPGRSDKYQGEWISDKKEGYGVFMWADGSVYKGHYINDLREGYGQMINSDGSAYRGNWKADQQIDPIQPDVSIEHEEDCQLFIPSKINYGSNLNEDTYPIQGGEYYLQNQMRAIPIPTYREPQRPAILNSASRNFRPRNLTKNSSRSQQRSRQDSRGKGMVKKMSVGTVSSKANPYKPNPERMLNSSFFLYKIHGQQSQSGKQQLNRRQIRTSGGSRGKQRNIDEELKYFARSKVSSYSQLE